MAKQYINFIYTDNMSYNNNEVETLKLNSTTIWTKPYWHTVWTGSQEIKMGGLYTNPRSITFEGVNSTLRTRLTGYSELGVCITNLELDVDWTYLFDQSETRTLSSRWPSANNELEFMLSPSNLGFPAKRVGTITEIQQLY